MSRRPCDAPCRCAVAAATREHGGRWGGLVHRASWSVHVLRGPWVSGPVQGWIAVRPVPALGNGGSPRPQGPRPPRRPADRRGQTQRWGSVDGAASPRCERRRAPDRGRWAWQLRRVAARCGVGLRPDPAGRRGHGVGVDDRERGPERSGGLPALRLTHRSLPAVSRSAPSARTVELSPRPASPGPGLVRVGVLFVPTHRLFRQLTGRLSRAVDVPSSSCMRPFPWPRLAYLGRPAFLGC